MNASFLFMHVSSYSCVYSEAMKNKYFQLSEQYHDAVFLKVDMQHCRVCSKRLSTPTHKSLIIKFVNLWKLDYTQAYIILYFVIAELQLSVLQEKEFTQETRDSQFLMHSCSTDKYSDRGKVHGAKWQNHSSSILPPKQWRSANQWKGFCL